jgi:hypothetical protein
VDKTSTCQCVSSNASLLAQEIQKTANILQFILINATILQLKLWQVAAEYRLERRLFLQAETINKRANSAWFGVDRTKYSIYYVAYNVRDRIGLKLRDSLRYSRHRENIRRIYV